MRIGYTDGNDCDFTIVISDDSQRDKAIECIEKGISAWYSAIYPNEYEGDAFTKDEVKDFYWLGYAEPAEILLQREGIEFESVESEYDDAGNLIADVIV